jgi:P-type Mg2+ transporter
MIVPTQRLVGKRDDDKMQLSLQEILGLPEDDLLDRLGSSQSGLTSREAQSRLQTYGHNILAERRRRTGFIEIIYHFSNPLILILLIAGIISGFTGDLTSTTIIFSIVLISVVLDVYQETKATNAAEALKDRVATTATVLRDGVKREVKLSEVVPGDIVYLSAGDIVPADARLIAAKDLNVNQSSLTGESFPADKTAGKITENATELTGWSNYVFLGTSVVSGTATAVIVTTGALTEYGKIAKQLVSRELPTEFERGLRRFGSLMVEVTLFLVLFVFIINAFFFSSTRTVLESLLFAVALAVGLTPELLPIDRKSVV